MFLPEQKSNWSRVLIIVFVAGVVGALLLLAFFLGMTLTRPDTTYQPSAPPIETPTDLEPDPVVGASPLAGPVADGVAVDWLPAAEQSPREFNPSLRRIWETEYNSVESGTTYLYSAKVLGTVRNADRENDLLVAESVSWDPDSIGAGTMTFYAIERGTDDAQPLVLSRYVVNEPTWTGFLSVPSDLDAIMAILRDSSRANVTISDAAIVGLDPAASVTDAHTGMAFSLFGVTAMMSPENLLIAARYPITVFDVGSAGSPNGLRQFKSPSVDDVVALKGFEGAYFRVGDDGRIAWYDPVIAFWNASGEQVQPMAITWVDGSMTDVSNLETSGYFKGVMGGCGFQSPTHVVSLDEATIAPAGTLTATGETIYEYKDYRGTIEFQNWQASHPDSELGFDGFVRMHPAFFYKDAFGRWIQFTKSDVLPPGECGKPVIYLYPTKTTELTVRLSPAGGFSKTEPAYGTGWNVTASPDGSLVNKADGLAYPYLFWEGRGGLYSAPSKFWVVKRADVHSFLVSTLRQLGLNDKESADFVEFWEPRMRSAPFYKVGFHGTSVMNAIAPMSISARPDTVLRVLMDYSPLNAPIAANPPVLGKPPVRKGFTVIEWGGVIR